MIEMITKELILETLLQQLQESLLTHCRPVQVAFHMYEILSEAGYGRCQGSCRLCLDC